MDVVYLDGEEPEMEKSFGVAQSGPAASSIGISKTFVRESLMGASKALETYSDEICALLFIVGSLLILRSVISACQRARSKLREVFNVKKDQ